MLHLVRGWLGLVDTTGTPISATNPLPVSSTPKTFSSASAPSVLTVGIVSISILAANTSRGLLTIQNVGTTIIYLNFGLVVATTTLFHFALKPGTITDDGLGAILISDEWKGDVQGVSSGVGGLLAIMEAM